MVERPGFPSVVDSSMMSAFRSCPHKFSLEYLWDYKPRTESVHLVAGKAFARGLEVARQSFYDGGQSPDAALAFGIGALLEEYGAFECPEDSAKSATRMAGALEYYFSQWPLGEDKFPPRKLASGKHCIEFSFAEPIEFKHPETGEPILYCGRFDQVVEAFGGAWGSDDKTTKALGATWPEQWDLRPQFTAYVFGAQRGGFPLQGFLIRGCAILKTRYEVAQAVSYRPQWMVDRWYEQTLRDLARMQEQWERGFFDMSLDTACENYGGCSFKKVCLAQEPQRWLEIDFERRHWDPVSRVETVL